MGVFERSLEDNLFSLYESLQNKTYKHGNYKAFYIHDPKIRHIHKACVQDRVVHHLISKVLEEIYEPTFYAHSYSCRKDRGTHKAVKALIRFARRASSNNTSKLFVLKCDVKKFFASVDHTVLMQLLARRIQDKDFLWLLIEVITSFQVENSVNKGMPIGNLTSQLFANIYMDPLDQYIKHELKARYYLRYADDFAVLSNDRSYLRDLTAQIEEFLKEGLKLSLHPGKVTIGDYYLGVDFLGYVVFPDFILPRTKTKRRMVRKISKNIQLYKQQRMSSKSLSQTVQSYLGYLSHASSYKLSQEIKNNLWYQLVG